MTMRSTILSLACALSGAASVHAAGAPATAFIYDDALENGFAGCDQTALYQFTAPVSSGTHAAGFTNGFGSGVNFCAPTPFSYTADYVGLDFWINGGEIGAPQLTIALTAPGSTSVPIMYRTIQSLYGPLPANTWVHIVVLFKDFSQSGAQLPIASIWLQDLYGTAYPGINVYLDDVKLIGNGIFADSFEAP